MLNPLAAPLIALLTALSLMPLGACSDETFTEPESPPPLVEVQPSEEPLDYGAPLPKNDPVDDEWFSNTAFIGHSLIYGFSEHGGLPEADYYYLAGSSVRNLMSSDQVNLADKSKGTLVSGLENKTYERIYLMMGINEIAGQRSQMKADYVKLIDLVRTYNPDAEIYVMAVIPVSYAKSSAGTFTLERILAYNEILLEICVEQECWYVDTYSCFANEDGYLPAASASDGIHLKSEQYKIMLEYLRTHTSSN